MAEPDDRRTDGAPPSHIHIEKKSANWLAWLLLALGILALLFALSRCNRHDDAVVAPAASPTATGVVAETPSANRSTVLGTTALAPYLAGNEATPRTFTFDKLNFDTAKSTIRAQNANNIDEVASTLKQYPKAHIRIAGYADSRGTDAANAALGKARADSVKAALVAKGVDGGRIDTATGGEKDPVDTNATAGGQFENRRTELVVTQR